MLIRPANKNEWFCWGCCPPPPPLLWLLPVPVPAPAHMHQTQCGTPNIQRGGHWLVDSEQYNEIDYVRMEGKTIISVETLGCWMGMVFFLLGLGGRRGSGESFRRVLNFKECLIHWRKVPVILQKRKTSLRSTLKSTSIQTMNHGPFTKGNTGCKLGSSFLYPHH